MTANLPWMKMGPIPFSLLAILALIFLLVLTQDVDQPKQERRVCTIIVTDDEPDEASKTIVATEIAVQDLGCIPNAILATAIASSINLAPSSPAGKQADLV